MYPNLLRREHPDASAWILVRVFGGEAAAETIHRRLRLRGRDPVPETRLHEEDRLVRAPFQRVGHPERVERGDRQPEVREDPDVQRAMVSGRSDADDRDRHAIDPDGAANHRRIGGEPGRPGVMAQHGDNRRAPRVLGRGEPSSERQAKAQHGRVRRGRVLDQGASQIAFVLVGHAVRNRCRHRAGEHVGVVRHVQVRRIRVGILPARVGGALVDIDEAVRIRQGFVAEQRRVDEAEDRGVGADAEAQDQNRRGGEAPFARQSPATAYCMSRTSVAINAIP